MHRSALRRFGATFTLLLALFGAMSAPSHACAADSMATTGTPASGGAHAEHQHGGSSESTDPSAPASCDCLGTACCAAILPWISSGTLVVAVFGTASSAEASPAPSIRVVSALSHRLPFAIGPPATSLI